MLPTSGLISMRDVATELKLSPSTELSLNDTRVRKLAKKTEGPIGFQDLLGKSNSIEVTMLHGASAAQTLISNPDATADACFSKGFYFTTDDDSEITFKDIVTGYHNAIYPNYSPVSFVGNSSSQPGTRYVENNTYNNLAVNTFYPLKDSRYPLEYLQYSIAGLRDKKVNPFTYYPTGNVFEYNYLSYMAVFDNLSKVNSNMTVVGADGVGGTSTLLIANVKADAKKVTDKINVGAIVIYSSSPNAVTGNRSYGVVIEKSKIKSVASGNYAPEGLFLMDDNVNRLFNARL